MRRALLLAVLALAACRPPTPTISTNHAFPDQPPVIDAQPVDAKSYDAGFKAGFSVGGPAASPGAKLPAQDEVRELAAAAATDDPARNKKWREGWANGYLDGFRNRALRTK